MEPSTFSSKFKNILALSIGVASIFLATLGVIKYLDLYIPLRITNSVPSNEFVVTGEGEVEVVPDTAELSVSIVVRNAKTAEAAESEITTINNNIMDVLTELGLQDEDLKTSQYSINPTYDYRNNREISGYDGNATITVKTQNVELIPQIITQATNAGANAVNNNGFTIDDLTEYEEKARQLAIKDAKEKAKKLAQELGISLGKITNYSEDGINPYPYYGSEVYAKDATMQVEEMPTPDIAVGTQTVTSRVTLFFATR